MSRTERKTALPGRWNLDLGTLLTAATFAEAGEPEIALEQLRDRRDASGSVSRCDRDRPEIVAHPRRTSEGSNG